MITVVKRTTAWVGQYCHHAIRLVALLACAPPVEVSPPPADAPATAVALAGAALRQCARFRKVLEAFLG